MEIHFYQTPSGSSPPADYIKNLDLKTRKKVVRAIDRLKKEGFALQRTSDIFEKVKGVDDVYSLKVPPRGKIIHRFMCGKVIAVIYILDAFPKKDQQLKKADIERSKDRLQELKKQWKT